MTRLLQTCALPLATCLAALAGCAHGPQALYQWDAFPHQQYDTLRGEGESTAQQIQSLEAQTSKASAAHVALPPGLRAHLGMLYLDAGDKDKARALWLAEKTAFPESAPYMDQLMKRLDGPSKSAQADGRAQ